MEMLARVHEKNFVKWAADKPKVLALSADLTSSVEIRLFRDTYPDRFLSMGVAEQNMLSYAVALPEKVISLSYIPLLFSSTAGPWTNCTCPSPILTCLCA